MTPEEQACYDSLRADYDALLAEVDRLREWQRRAEKLLYLVPRRVGSDLAAEVHALIEEAGRE